MSEPRYYDLGPEDAWRLPPPPMSEVLIHASSNADHYGKGHPCHCRHIEERHALVHTGLRRECHDCLCVLYRPNPGGELNP